MKNKKCSWHNKCQNGGGGCFHHEPEKCVRYLPLQDTHVTKINFTVETPPHIDSDAFTEMFINWLECMGWRCVGFSESIKEDE